MFDQHKTAADDGVRRAWLGVGAPILGLVAVMILLAVATFASFARDQDQAFELNSRRLMASAVDGRVRSLTSVTLDYANWDEAFNAVSGRWDQDWVENNIYSSVADGMILLRADGEVRFAWFNEAVAPDAAAITPAAVRAAIATPRLRQLARAPTPAGTVAHTYARQDGQLLLIGLAPFTPEDNAARLAHRSAGSDYIALVDIVSADELSQIGQSLDFDDVAFFASTQAASQQAVTLPLETPAGAPVGAIEWRRERPGTEAFHGQIWPVILALIVVGGLAVLTARLLVVRQVGAMAHARAAMESSQLKSEFLTRVSHELRTPLNAIIGYAEIIQEENEDKGLQEDSGRIITAARHLGHLLNDILDQSRIDAGGVRINLEVLPVAGLLAEVHGLLGPSARTNAVQLSVTASAHTAYVFADHTRLRQCLINLVGNAIKFAPRGRVSLKTRGETIAERDMVVFEVVDDGIGIAKPELQNLFRPFSQANAEINKRFGGTGLGLSISRDLARAMGGDISVVSELGHGSTFSLIIPAATAHALRAA